MPGSRMPRHQPYPVVRLIVIALAAIAVAAVLAWSAGTVPSTATPASTAAPASPSVTVPASSTAMPLPAATSSPTVAPSPAQTVSSQAVITAQTALRFNGRRAYQFVLDQEALGIRPTGSDAGWKTGDYIISQMEGFGWEVSTQEFLYLGVRVRNVIGKGGAGPFILLGAHYDTRPAADQDPDPAKRSEPILGANDGGSGVAVLLELARVLKHDTLKHEVWLAFFDAEDRGRLDGWPFSVGARETARRLTLRPQAMVLVDMVGDADQNIYYEGNSHPRLAAEIWAVAGELGYGDTIIPQLKHTITDDHIPFVEMGIPAVDIIDFDYPYWHTTRDTSDKVSADSLERVGRTLQTWLEEKE